MKPKRIKILQERARHLHATVLNPHTVIVESTSNPAANHVVTLAYQPDGTIQARCTCPWAINGGVGCTHVLAALEALAARRGRVLSFWADREAARRQKRRMFHLPGRDDDGIWITSRAA